MKRFLFLWVWFCGASPVFAAGWAPSLSNTDFVVALAFVLFIAILVYLKVPGKIGGLLDQRAATIKTELDEARALRDEAQAVLASYERKQKEIQDQAEKIILAAQDEARLAADQAKVDLKKSIARRLQAAEDQIASAEEAAVKEVRDVAVSLATNVARDVMMKDMTSKTANDFVNAAIEDVRTRLH